MMEERQTLSEIAENASLSPVPSAQTVEDPAMDELSKKMLSWSRLWFGSSENSKGTEEQNLVRERLLHWLKLCIGLEAGAVLTCKVENISLATSTPLLTALIGRRAMLDLSRRVLNDS
jgi:hypothetical protein